MEALIGGDGNNDNVNSFLNYNVGSPFTADSVAGELVTSINQFVSTDARVNNSNAVVRVINVQNSFAISTSNITTESNEYTITIGASSGLMILVEDSTTSTDIGTFSLDFELIITITNPSTTPLISASNFNVLTYTSV